MMQQYQQLGIIIQHQMEDVQPAVEDHQFQTLAMEQEAIIARYQIILIRQQLVKPIARMLAIT